MVKEIKLEILLGKRIIDSTGKQLNWRIQEVRAEQDADEWVIREYLLGTTAILERLSVGTFLYSFFRSRQNSSGYKVPWDKLDLTNVEKPRLLCPLDELEKLS